MNQAKNSKLHQPVMLNQAIEGLNPKPELTYVDATFGRGGHTLALLKKQVKVIAFDFDQEAIKFAQDNFADYLASNQLVLVKQNFNQLKAELDQFKQPIGGILFDFGTTQDQLKSEDRGFSFDITDSQLDMRMDQTLGLKASDLINVLSAKQLVHLFTAFGGESPKISKKIARLIDKYRGPNRENQIDTVGQLVSIITQVKHRRGKLHPATKIFQALRIAVNDELNNIKQALPQAIRVLVNKGRIVTIAFHEGEDRIAKHQFRDWEKANKGQMLTDKPLQPSLEEKQQNPAARSAKLRIFEKQES